MLFLKILNEFAGDKLGALEGVGNKWELAQSKYILWTDEILKNEHIVLTYKTPGMVVHAFNLSTWKADIGRSM